MTTPLPSPVTAFTYLYRDAANYKAFGTVLLAGPWTDADTATLRATLLDATWFVPERVGLPSLRPALEVWSDGPTDNDHDFHELVDIVAATPEQRADLPIHTTTAAFLGIWQDSHASPAKGIVTRQGGNTAGGSGGAKRS